MWQSAEAGAYQSPGNADSACGSLWSWTIGHAAAYRDGGHADLFSVSDYIGCGGALRPVLLGTNMDETQVLHSLSQSRYLDRTAWLMSIDCFWNCF